MTCRDTLTARIEAHWPLLNEARWWLWRAVPRANGKLGKVPVVQMRGRLVAHDANDRVAWRPWEDVRGAFLAGAGSGVGFALGNGLVCVDLDACSDGRGELDADARDLLNSLGGYAEFSPANGIHLLAYCEGQPGRTRRSGRREYLTSGMVSVTGNALAGRALPPAPAEQLDRLWSQLEPPPPAPVLQAQGHNFDLERMLATARRLRNWPRFEALWSGDVSRHPSPSQADFALCRQLVFLLGPHEALVDAAFRHSGLYANRSGRWDRFVRRGPPPLTYGQLTVARAAALGGPSLPNLTHSHWRTT